MKKTLIDISEDELHLIKESKISLTDIANKYKFSRYIVENTLKHLGIPNPHIRTCRKLERFRSCVGLSSKEIAQKLNIKLGHASYLKHMVKKAQNEGLL